MQQLGRAVDRRAVRDADAPGGRGRRPSIGCARSPHASIIVHRRRRPPRACPGPGETQHAVEARRRLGRGDLVVAHAPCSRRRAARGTDDVEDEAVVVVDDEDAASGVNGAPSPSRVDGRVREGQRGSPPGTPRRSRPRRPRAPARGTARPGPAGARQVAPQRGVHRRQPSVAAVSQRGRHPLRARHRLHETAVHDEPLGGAVLRVARGQRDQPPRWVPRRVRRAPAR